MAIKKIIFLSLMTFLFISDAFSQNNRIEGQVKSKGENIGYARVILEGTSQGAVTDSAGNFTIDNVPAGVYLLKVSSMGFEDLTRKVVVEADKPVRLELELKEEGMELEEVVITGTMKEVSKSSSPIPVEVYTEAYFKKNPTPNLFEALQIVNGVQPQLNCNVCNTGDIHINGMEGPYTMVTIDGMPIVSSLSTVYGLSGIPNSMVQRIEVVKGPASTLYGSEAVGGLVNVITKDPSAVPKASIDFFATSHQEYNTDLSYKLKLKKHSSMLGINYFNFNNKRDINKDNFKTMIQCHKKSPLNARDFIYGQKF